MKADEQAPKATAWPVDAEGLPTIEHGGGSADSKKNGTPALAAFRQFISGG